MGTVLYNIIIQPLIVIYDIIFVLLYGMIEDPILTILALSIVINFLALPLYWKADAIQREEQEKQTRMQPWIRHIRKHFSGDERFMMLSAYYKVEHYNPLCVLKEAGPLALQIPFFMAAYRYISHITLLEGASFGPIANLLAPDALIHLGGITINILPVIMTGINCVSGFIYSRNGNLRLKIQIYGTAMVFLALLYNSPSGLVIYWIMNQLFSLGKNIYYIKKDKLNGLVPVIAAISVIVAVSVAVSKFRIDALVDVFLAECMMVVSIVTIVLRILKEYHVKKPVFLERIAVFLETGKQQRLFTPVLLTEACLVILMGLFIPTSVVSSSATEFINKSTNTFQTELLIYPFTVYVGLLLIWMTVIVYSRDGKKRENLAAGLWIALGVALVNQFFFDPHVGFLYSDLIFEGELRFTFFRIFANIISCIAVGIVFLLIFVKKTEWVKRMAIIIGMSLIILSTKNVLAINNTVKDAQNTESGVINNGDGILNLSRNGKNVIVLMLDRAIGGYVPFIFDEKPELKESFRGFVYYPDTVSFGEYTNTGVPGLFGGYEYTPMEMNKRDDETLAKKHNEAMRMMPVLFLENGYDVTVCDPPYAGYKDKPDLSIYDEYPEIHTYNLIGKFSARFNHLIEGDLYERQKHNIILYSLFRTVPLSIKSYVYADGTYLSKTLQSMTGVFVDTYSTLLEFPGITLAHDDGRNCFLMLQNSLTHQPTALEPPEYDIEVDEDGNITGSTASGVKAEHPDRTLNGKTLKISKNLQWEHYCVNMVAYRLIGVWLDKLKELGVYDNTRIIIVADHGRDLGQFEELIHPDGLDIEFVWPVLLVKDFEADGEFTTSTEFMTNADVPVLATEGIINNPVNPFTGARITNEAKFAADLLILDSPNFLLSKDNTFDMRNSYWWTVHSSIFDLNNWKRLD